MNTYRVGIMAAILAWLVLTLALYLVGQFSYSLAVLSILGGNDLVMIFGQLLLTRRKPPTRPIRSSVIYFSIPLFSASFLLYIYAFPATLESVAFWTGIGLSIVGTTCVLFLGFGIRKGRPQA